MTIGFVRTGCSVLFSIASLAMASSAAAQGQCARETLEEVAGQYVEGQRQGSIFTLPVGEWVDYRENDQLASTATGVISQPSEFAWHLDVADPGSCRVIVYGVILEPKPYVLATQLAYTFNGLGQIRSTVIRHGDAGFDAAATRAFAAEADWSDIPADKRDSRDTLIAVATAYLDRLDGKSADVAIATPCARIDNSVASTDCAPAPGTALVDREFTVDDTKGAVAVTSHRGAADGPPDIRIFRIEGGKVRLVHAITP